MIPHKDWSALDDKSSVFRIVGFRDDDGVYDGAGVYGAVAPDDSEYLAVRVPREQVMAAFPFPMADQGGGDAIQPVAATIENVKAELLREVSVRGGNILGQTKALAHIRSRRFVGHDIQGTVRRAVQELSGGRRPGER